MSISYRLINCMLQAGIPQEQVHRALMAYMADDLDRKIANCAAHRPKRLEEDVAVAHPSPLGKANKLRV